MTSFSPAAGSPVTLKDRLLTYSTSPALALAPLPKRLFTSDRLSPSVTVSSLKFGASGCLSTSSRTLGRELVALEILPLTPGPQPLTFAFSFVSAVVVPLWP